MAHEAIFQAIRDETAALKGVMATARDFLEDVRGYAITIHGLIVTGAVSVQNFPALVPVNVQNFPATQPVSIPGLPIPLPVSLPALTPITAAVSLTATGALIAAQSGAIKLLAGVFGATASVTLSLRDGSTDVLPIRLLANASVVLPFNERGWMVTSSGAALNVAFAGANTVTAFGQWVSV